MNFRGVVVEAVAHVEPPVVVTSRAIEERLAPLYERVGLEAGRLEMMTGIRERRFWEPDTKPSEASTRAGAEALARSRFEPGEIDLVIHAAVSRDQLEPATAASVHGALGLSPQAAFFDLSNACLGFLNGMVTAAAMIASGQVGTALVVAGENGGPLLERTIDVLNQPGQTRRSIKPYIANLTIGSGAAAAILAHDDRTEGYGHRLLGGVTRSDTSSRLLCQGDTIGAGLEMLTDSPRLLEAGIRLTRATWQDLNALPNAADWQGIVTHQVGKAHQKAMHDALGLNPDLDYVSYPTFGNTGAAAMPLTLARAARSDRFRPGDRIGLLGIGSGLSCLMLALQW